VIDGVAPSVSTILRTNSNPTTASSVDFTVTFTENVSGVDAANFDLHTTGSISGASITLVSGSGSSYTVTVSTGSNSGTIRLDLVSIGIIKDAVGNDLAGTHIGDQSYTLDHTNPSVSSSVRADASPTAASIVNFTVTFTETVTGVGTGDFSLTTTGTISGPFVTGISGTGATRTVAVNTGTGEGTIRLNVLDDDTILDLVGHPLGGAGIGNGNFSSGEAYTIAKPATSLVNSVLPTSRSVQVGTLATVFNTVLNSGGQTASGVTLTMANPPAGAFSYQESNCANNTLIGSMNPSLDIAAGQARCYVLFFTPSAAFTSTDVHIRAQATNAPATTLLPGINTWTLRATNSAGPDIVALTTTTDFHQLGCSGTRPFAVALANVGGATSQVTVTADSGAAGLPLRILVEETNPSTGVVIGDNILENVGAGENRTVVVWVTFRGCINFDPAANRIFVRFKDASNNLIGSTSTAVSTNR
jgi:hypothetical protein